MRIWVVLIAGTLGAQTPRASISGEVSPVGVDSRVKTSIRIQGQGELRSVMAAREVDDGRFVFEDLAPGEYTLSAQRPGFVQQFYNASPSRPFGGFTLRPGQELSGIRMQLVPEGVLTGQVLNPDDEPVGPAKIIVWRRTWSRGRPQLQSSRVGAAGPDGRFRVAGLPPGKYYLSVDPAEREDLTGSYFPNAIDPAAAAPITVGAGSETGGISLHLRRERVFRLRGRVVDTGGAVVRNVALGLLNSSGSTALSIAREGTFAFSRLRPGTYVLATQIVMLNGQPVRPDVPLVGRKAITISDADVDDVVLELHAPARVAGSIRAEKQQPKIRLLAEELPAHSTAAVESGEDGLFAIDGIAPDRYQVEATGLAAGSYVKSVRFANQDARDGVIYLTAGNGGSLEIAVEPDGADVAGVVRDAKGAGCPDIVMSLWGRAVKTVISGANGEFHFGNLAPGDYKVAAWEGVEPDLAALPAFLDRFASAAITVSGGRSAPRLTPIPKATDAEAANFR